MNKKLLATMVSASVALLTTGCLESSSSGSAATTSAATGGTTTTGTTTTGTTTTTDTGLVINTDTGVYANAGGAPGSTPGDATTVNPDPNYPPELLADQDSFSISVDVRNPEAFNYDGEVVNMTVRMANSTTNTLEIPDGLRVYFSSEGGAIQPYCELQNSACSVQWVSQDPRPEDGRVTVLAWAAGVETFTDLNANGVLDQPSEYDTARDLDIPEPYRDDNENGERDSGAEHFVDFDGDSAYDVADGLYSGSFCESSSGKCAAAQTLWIWDNSLIIMSGSLAAVRWLDPSLNEVDVASGVCAFVTDQNGNSLPAGTTVSLELLDSAPDTVPKPDAVTVSDAATEGFCVPYVGAFVAFYDHIKVTTPKGNISQIYFI